MVEYIVAIDVTRVRFPADAILFSWCNQPLSFPVRHRIKQIHGKGFRTAAPALRDQTLGRHFAPHFIASGISWWMVYHSEKGRINISGATHKRIHINRALCNSFFHFSTEQNIHAERKEKNRKSKAQGSQKAAAGGIEPRTSDVESGGFPCRRAAPDL